MKNAQGFFTRKTHLEQLAIMRITREVLGIG